MRILVPFKILFDDQDISVRPDRTLDYSRASLVVSAFDLNAMEAAVRVAADSDAEIIALSVGAACINDSKLRKNVLARGASSLYLVADDVFSEADAHVTAKAIVAAMEKIGDVDLVICGNGSADNYAQQVNVHIAELLGAASICGAKLLSVEDGKAVAQREVAGFAQKLEAPLPAVVSVTPDAAPVRICTMKEILAAGKKPVTVWDSEELGIDPSATMEIVSILAPEPMSRKGILADGSDVEAVKQFASALAEAAK